MAERGKEKLYGVTHERSLAAWAYGSITKGWCMLVQHHHDGALENTTPTTPTTTGRPAKAALSTRGSAVRAGPLHTAPNDGIFIFFFIKKLVETRSENDQSRNMLYSPMSVLVRH